MYYCVFKIALHLLLLLTEISGLSEQLTIVQENPQAVPGETVTLITELPEEGLEVTWLKDNVPLLFIDEKYKAINKDASYELVIPDVTVEDGGEYKVQGGGYEATVPLTVVG